MSTQSNEPDRDTTVIETETETGTETGSAATATTDESRPAQGTTETAGTTEAARTAETDGTGALAQPMAATRTRTVVLGAILMVIAGLAILREALDVRPDPGAVLVSVMIGLGVLLVAGGVRRG